MSKKYLLIALIVVAQIGLAYFLITYFIIPALLAEKDPNEASVETEETEEDEETEEGSGEIYVVEDVIVNPAGTLGTRLPCRDCRVRSGKGRYYRAAQEERHGIERYPHRYIFQQDTR